MKPTRYLWMGLFFLFYSLQAGSQNDTILIDFGNNPTPPPWNNLSDANAGQIAHLLNAQGLKTAIGIAVVDSFNSINTNGTIHPDPALGIPATASGDSFFGNAVFFSNDIQPTGGIALNGLNPDKSYTLSIFASRVANDNRETQYIVSGLTIDTLWLNVASNTDQQVVTELFPAADGTIRVVASPGQNNNNAYKFFYLGVMQIAYAHEDASGPAALELISPNGGEYWQAGKQVSILWRSENLAQAILDYSVDGGESWLPIDTLPAYFEKYNWMVPLTVSSGCLVRIMGDTLTDLSDAPFQIADDPRSCPIVVIGSSTAEGTGASTQDSAWVDRYRAALYQNDTRLEVFNLALGGYTTYHLLPTGTVIPPGVGIAIDPERNVTRALTYNPTAIVINLPSNDTRNNISTEQQLVNFRQIVHAIRDAGAAAYVCTTQPRNFSDPEQITIQQVVRDSIFAEYGDAAIDFWTGLADENGYILPELDSGDGVHVNDQGHRWLVRQVLDKRVDTLCDLASSVLSIKKKEIEIDLFPNPFKKVIHMEFEATAGSRFSVALYDFLGRKVDKIEQTIDCTGLQKVTWTPLVPSNYGGGIFYGQLLLLEKGKVSSSSLQVLKIP